MRESSACEDALIIDLKIRLCYFAGSYWSAPFAPSIRINHTPRSPKE